MDTHFIIYSGLYTVCTVLQEMYIYIVEEQVWNQSAYIYIYIYDQSINQFKNTTLQNFPYIGVNPISHHFLPNLTFFTTSSKNPFSHPMYLQISIFKDELNLNYVINYQRLINGDIIIYV